MLTARIEELVVVLFLPVFFAVTGLKTDLMQALDGRMIGVTVAVVLIASGAVIAALAGSRGRADPAATAPAATPA